MICAKCGERSCFCGLTTYGTGPTGKRPYGEPATVKRVIERGPWTHYARCDECGVDAGKACRDEHDREAVEVCDGRRLVIVDAAAKLAGIRDRRRVGTSERARQRRDREPPPPVACSICGDPCPRGRRKFCGARCQHRSRLVVPRPETVPCHWCAAPCSIDGRGLHAAMPACGDRACRRARSRILQAASRSRQRSQISPDTAS